MAKPKTKHVTLHFSERERRLYEQLAAHAEKRNIDLAAMIKSIAYGAMLRGEGFETIVEIGTRAARARRRRNSLQRWERVDVTEWASPPWRVVKKELATISKNPDDWWRLVNDDDMSINEPLAGARVEALRIADELIIRKYS